MRPSENSDFSRKSSYTRILQRISCMMMMISCVTVGPILYQLRTTAVDLVPGSILRVSQEYRLEY
jgi:hypothetical protein